MLGLATMEASSPQAALLKAVRTTANSVNGLLNRAQMMMLIIKKAHQLVRSLLFILYQPFWR